MTDPQIAIMMLGIFILIVLLGFPIAFTLVAMGLGFGYYAYYDPERMQTIFDNRIFDLLVQNTFSVMSNEVLVAVPLFLFMGYVVERANIVDRLFFSIQMAAHRVPGSMAVAALATCAVFATATGIIGAVVTLMGLLALPAMLKAGYETRFASGVICAGGCLGILIPPSIMLIVYAAIAEQSPVRLYAAALFPGMMLAGLYMVYVVGRAWANPKLAPKPKQQDIPSIEIIIIQLLTSFVPLALLIFAVLGSILNGAATPAEAAGVGAFGGLFLAACYRASSVIRGIANPAWISKADRISETSFAAGVGGLCGTTIVGFFILSKLEYAIIGTRGLSAVGNAIGIGFGQSEPSWPMGIGISVALVVGILYRAFGRHVNERIPALAKSAALRGILGAGGIGAICGGALGVLSYFLGPVLGEKTTFWLADVGFYVGFVAGVAYRVVDWERLKEAVFLTARTSAMVCWLFVGSWTFASVFSYLGGHTLIEQWVLSMELGTVGFLILAQTIIFLLGWPLEWTEIIIIFVPIFLPMLDTFNVDPLFFGILVALNLQTSFLTPPMAMAAYYLKGVAPPHVQLIQIFQGIMPFLGIVILAMVLIYIFPGIALWAPVYFFGS